MRTVTQVPEVDAQLELPIGDLVYPEHPEGATIQQRYEAFDRANRWVYFSYVLLTEDWLNRGYKRASIGMFTEVIRHQFARQTTGDRFRLNNNLRSRYVRALIAEHPEWNDVFETRELRTP